MSLCMFEIEGKECLLHGFAGGELYQRQTVIYGRCGRAEVALPCHAHGAKADA